MTEPLKLLQLFLKKNNLDAMLVPRTDEFLGEFIAPYAERLKWISSFSGSFGIAVIFHRKAAIFTDGRYTTQITKEVNSKRFSICHIKDFNYWLYKNLIQGSTLAIDPRLFSSETINSLKSLLKKKSIIFHLLEKNPIDFFWKNQPKYPSSKVFFHHKIYSGKITKNKIIEIRKEMKKNACNYYYITNLDSIAWLLNLRGSDVEYSPVNLAYFLLPLKGKGRLYIDSNKLDKKIILKILPMVEIAKFVEIEQDINLFNKSSITAIDLKKTPYWFVNLLNKNEIKIRNIDDYCYKKKSIKNKTELNGARKANIRDGVSVTKFLYWLKNNKNINNINETKASERLFQLRKKNKLFFSLAFETISAFGSNAALPHYRVNKKSNKTLNNKNIYLFDSGAQYFDGTTDITRTVVFGHASEKQKEHFTRVLKGHIALANKKFSNKTRGSDLDYIARKSLKKINCDYDHGTGHGVGSFLNVHEGPQKISKLKNRKDPFLKEGMILSNEPGYYKKNSYGIRIENLIIVKRKNKNLLNFETISFSPIDRDLILLDLLDNIEKNWLNTYHRQVYNKLSKYLDYKEKKWLKKVTEIL